MNKPDTLVISGASTKVLCFCGIFRALFEKNIVDVGLTSIKEIHTVSIGTFYSYCLLLGMSEKVIYECMINSDFRQCLNVDSIDFNSFIHSMGLVTHGDYFRKIMKIILLHTFNKPDITLKELHEYNPITLFVKCVNISTQSSVHFSHITHPNMSITELLIMTTTLPVLFRAQKYKGDYYVDGGISGNLPIEKVKSKNAICIHIKRSLIDIDKEEFPILGFLQNMCCISSVSYNKYKRRTINVIANISTFDFNVEREQKNTIIKKGYEQTLSRLNDEKFFYNSLVTET